MSFILLSEGNLIRKIQREAPWSSGERRGLTSRHGPGTWVRILTSPKKTRWKDGPLDGRKKGKIIKTAKWGKSHQKKIFKENLVLKKTQLVVNYLKVHFKIQIKK